jgi:hypothetical protein
MLQLQHKHWNVGTHTLGKDNPHRLHFYRRVLLAVAAHIRSLPFIIEDRFGPPCAPPPRSPSVFIRFREFSSTHTES